MKLTLLIIAFILTIPIMGVHAQYSYTDSLENKLKSSVTISDSFDILYEIIVYGDYISSNIPKYKEYAETADKLYKKLTPIPYDKRIALLFSLGKSNLQMGNRKVAGKYLEEVKLLLDTFPENEKSNRNKAIIYSTISSLNKATDLGKAYEYAIKSLEFAKKSNDKNVLAQCYMSIGSIYSGSKDFRKSILYYNKVLEIQGLKPIYKIDCNIYKLGAFIGLDSLEYADSTLSVLAMLLDEFEYPRLKAIHYAVKATLQSKRKQYTQALKSSLLADSFFLSTEDNYHRLVNKITFIDASFQLGRFKYNTK